MDLTLKDKLGSVMTTRALEDEFEHQTRCGKSVQNDIVKNAERKEESCITSIFHQQNDMKDMV